jgi:hypothetical protein
VTGSGRPLLAAPVGGMEAWLIAQVLDLALPAQIERWERVGVSAALLARVRRAHAAIGEAGRQAAVVEAERRAASTLGHADMPGADMPAGSQEIDAATAGGLLGVSPRQARRLAAAGVVTARRLGGQWLFERGSVETHRLVRMEAT